MPAAEAADVTMSALRWTKDRKLTQQDKQILEMVLLDMLTHKDKDNSWTAYGQSAIMLENRTSYLHSDNQINGELEETQAFDITTAMRQHLQRRPLCRLDRRYGRACGSGRAADEGRGAGSRGERSGLLVAPVGAHHHLDCSC